MYPNRKRLCHAQTNTTKLNTVTQPWLNEMEPIIGDRNSYTHEDFDRDINEQQSDNMKKTVQIITVPSHKEGWNKNDLLKLISGKSFDECDWVLAGREKDNMVEGNWQAQQLLVLSDDEIKESDRSQILDLDTNQVFCNIANTISSTHVRISKVIASYPQIEGTLPISKETVQAWINAGTPGEGSVEMYECYGKCEHNNDYVCDRYGCQTFKPKIDHQGNLLLKFDKKYKNTGNDLSDLAEPIDKIIANATTKP